HTIAARDWSTDVCPSDLVRLALARRGREIEASEREANALRAAQVTELERVSGLTSDEAREVIVAQVAQGIRDVCVRRAREIELEAAEGAELWARQIIATAIQRYASDQATESAVSVVPMPNEEIRNRI